jgi:signal transduction histidine kinase/ActR/RegA family two-component response regulator
MKIAYKSFMATNRFIYLILAAFIAGMLLLIFIQYNSSRSIDQLIEGNGLLLNELKVGNDLRETERDLLSVESKIRAAVATGDSSFMRGIDEQIDDAEANLDTLRVINQDPRSIADIDQLAVLARAKLDKKNRILDSFLYTGPIRDKSIIADPEATKEINPIIRRLFNRREERLANLNISIQKNGRIARTGGIVLISLVLLTGAGLLWFIIHRIRRQNELIRKLDASEKKLQEAVRIKENFMANMSHEIRTPLNSIIGFTSLLAKQPMTEPSREFVTAIAQSGENLLDIINDILDLSKIEAGMMRLESNPFSVRDLFHSIGTLFQQRISEKGLIFHSVVEDTVPDLLLGDVTRLTQILVNLIGNALKFTDRGEITVRVYAGVLQQQSLPLWVSVSDTGIGIGKQQIGAIFDRFSQAEESITRKYGGTGLGLSIVKDLIDLQKGAIEVESEPGRGTTFRFYIPYGILSQPSIPAHTAPAPAAAVIGVKGSRVLVVDDNRMNQRLMQHLLAGQGISYDMADDGQKAIALLRQKSYHLVLMDIQMPVMDGYTASRYIRQELQLTVPIVAMTAHAMPGERERCLANGMNEYLSKPVVERELFRIIGQFLRAFDNQTPGGQALQEPVVPFGVVKSEIVPGEASSAADAGYRFIDPDYLKQISNDDRAYEIEMTDQFLEAIPRDLSDLRTALSAGDPAAVSHIAHSMKTDVSIMGMTERLYLLLDALEYPTDGADLSVLVAALQQICEPAMEEARRFRKG